MNASLISALTYVVVSTRSAVKWTSRNQLEKQGADGISIFDAVNKELDLKLEKTKRNYPVLVIDHIEETPTEN